MSGGHDINTNKLYNNIQIEQNKYTVITFE